MRTVVVIGGGASGMMAALTAAEDKNNKVILLERQQRVGRKLLATGNGRCNLTNTGAAPENYHGENPEFALPALEKFPPRAALEFFRALGLLTVTEYGGRVYPLSNSANSVLDVLRFALAREGVELRAGCSARQTSGGRRLSGENGERGNIRGQPCCRLRRRSGAKLGGVNDGYELLKPLGHKRTKLLPALVQLRARGDYPRSLKGRPADWRPAP